MTRLNSRNGHSPNHKLGIAIVGLGGAVATTAVAGGLLMKHGQMSRAGLPLAEFDSVDLAEYTELEFAGWDLYTDNLYEAAVKHDVLDHRQLDAIADDLKSMKPWQAIANRNFCSGVTVEGEDTKDGLRAQIECLQQNLQDFGDRCGRIVVINLASTEHSIDASNPIFQTVEAFEQALDDNSTDISPAMLYAYAAIKMGIPYGNFTPSTAVDIPALLTLSKSEGVPVAGKDGKTGQTFLKTVMAPALRARALEVEGWFSTNILGNRDGKALSKPESLKSKIDTKGSVLDSCLGYPVDNHMVQIHYYKPRGDNKEAWDNIDVTGFLGHKMQIKVNFLCKDSILAAPLIIEIARCLDFAQRKGESGAAEALGVFFKMPLTQDLSEPEHRFPVQQRMLEEWLHTPGENTVAANPDYKLAEV